METAVQKIEVLFNQAEQELVLLEAKVDRIANSLTTSSDNSSQSPVQPQVTSVCKVVNNIHELRSDLKQITADVEDLRTQQSQMVQSIEDQVKQISDQYQSLSHTTGYTEHQQDTN